VASKTWSWIIQLLSAVLGPLVGILSPQIRTLLVSSIQKLYVKAAETPNIFDDMLVELLAGVLGIELEKE